MGERTGEPATIAEDEEEEVRVGVGVGVRVRVRVRTWGRRLGTRRMR